MSNRSHDSASRRSSPARGVSLRRPPFLIACFAALVFGLVPPAASGQEMDAEALRSQAAKLQQDGNYGEAFEMYKQLALDPATDARLAADALSEAVSDLQQLNRVNERDEFVEQVIEAHSEKWQVLQRAAWIYRSRDHNGFLIAGKFERGEHRGGGQPANVADRDRVRALQLMNMALPLVQVTARPVQVAQFCRDFAEMVLEGRFGQRDAWRLQYLTDFSELPEPDEGYAQRFWGGETRGAPVDADGKPVFHHVPKSWQASETDGERWRWLLDQAVRASDEVRDEVLLDYAEFLQSQFGVQTMADFGFRPRSEEGDESGTYALHTLDENETIARLATGVKRFQLPDEFNYIKVFQKIGNQGAERALRRLADIFENRRQYPAAVGYWRRLLALPSIDKNTRQNAEERLKQIVGNWGAFEPVMSQPADQGATVDYLYRNGKSVRFIAQSIDVERLLNDARDYIESQPGRMDWQKLNLENIGHRLVVENQKEYIKEEVATWTLKLDPRPGHFDRRITIDTPLQKAGAYLLTAEMGEGNTSRIVLWVDDTAIARKQMDGEVLYFVADARTGKALPGATLDFFGYRQQRKLRGSTAVNEFETIVKKFSKTADADGLITIGSEEMSDDMNWLVTCEGRDGRLAFLGFDRVWYGRRHDPEYNEVKVLGITDRPVYRPGQPVRFKAWVRHAQYDQEDVSQFAGQSFTVEVMNPKGDKIYTKSLKTDEFGGLNDELTLAGDATLGVYQVDVDGAPGRRSAVSFRVEEYKKPEFEVTVEAPEKPVMLGETVTAKVQAKYYFGEPVREAKVKIKVLRHEHSATWYPPSPWDWFYGAGYWWFGYDYAWYPGWRAWGCPRPWPFWWHRSSPAPEVVAEQEVEIDENGEAEIEIDTRLAAELHGDTDHRYEITVEVTDLSRRTIVGKGEVLVARRPFQVYAWTHRGYYRVGDTIEADFAALTLDRRPVAGRGVARLLRVTYERAKDGGELEPREVEVQRWDLDPDPEGLATLQAKASEPGQYRFSWAVTDEAGHEIEGGYVFVIRGEGFDGSEFRFNDIEIVTDKKEYRPGEKVRLMVNANRAGATVLLFVRPVDGVYLPPRVLHLEGKSTVAEIEVTKKDMPNFFVEAMTVAGARVHTEARQIAVPPETRVLDLEVEPSAEEYLPGETASVQLRLRDHTGEPFVGSLVVTAYDKALEYISGGSNVPDMKEFFWKWRRHHSPATPANLERRTSQVLRPTQKSMRPIGVFGASVADEMEELAGVESADYYGYSRDRGRMAGGAVLRSMAMGEGGVHMALSAPAPMADNEMLMEKSARAEASMGGGAEQVAAEATPMIRQAFADNAFWAAAITTDSNGLASFTMTMPDNLTAWKIKSWAMGHGTKVGEASREIVTRKNVIVRLQAPRFFVEKDEVVISANVHNYLATAKSVGAVLELEGGCLRFDDGIGVVLADDPDGQPDVLRRRQTVDVDANGEVRVDWRVKVVREGEALIRVKALTDEESDAMEQTYPVFVHGQEKMVPASGMTRPEKESAKVVIDVPKERRIDESRLEIRYSPTLAGAMVDALPYLVSYPYGCTEQTLNRFLPTAITQRILLEMGLNLKDIRDKRSNLNAQELGDDAERAAQWKRYRTEEGEYAEPVFDEEKVRDMVETGVQALLDMQLSDGGWGWFSGYGEYASAHTTAVVVHGLQIARENDVAVPDDVLERGVDWLRRHEEEQVVEILNNEKDTRPSKPYADNLDAFVYMVLADAGHENGQMRDFLYRDREHLAVYAKALVGLAFHKQNHAEERDMLIRNIEQYLVRDDENQTAYLNLPNTGYWWYWYGSEWEAHGYYLKLLAKTGRTDDWKAPYLVKYLLNNRKHATYWNSTRDTAVCIEAFADYLRATDEHKPDLTVEILVDGVKRHEARITAENLFSFDNRFVLEGDAVESGRHEIEIRKTGTGPLYFNAYLTYFSLEDFITRAGLEVKVLRDVYRLVPKDKTIKVAGSRGQVADQRVEAYERRLLESGDTLKSGDLVLVEMVIESKNDYEYLVFEDMKAAGFEPVEVRSGYTGNEMGAYVEFRDNRTAFFVRQLARGRHSVSYRLRAEIPGRFSALPARGYAMYAPELRGNSDEIKLAIED